MKKNKLWNNNERTKRILEVYNNNFSKEEKEFKKQKNKVDVNNENIKNFENKKTHFTKFSRWIEWDIIKQKKEDKNNFIVLSLLDTILSHNVEKSKEWIKELLKIFQTNKWKYNLFLSELSKWWANKKIENDIKIKSLIMVLKNSKKSKNKNTILGDLENILLKQEEKLFKKEWMNRLIEVIINLPIKDRFLKNLYTSFKLEKWYHEKTLKENILELKNYIIFLEEKIEWIKYKIEENNKNIEENKYIENNRNKFNLRKKAVLWNEKIIAMELKIKNIEPILSEFSKIEDILEFMSNYDKESWLTKIKNKNENWIFFKPEDIISENDIERYLPFLNNQ